MTTEEIVLSLEINWPRSVCVMRRFAATFFDRMYVGLLLMLSGCLLVIENKSLADRIGRDYSHSYTEFSTSVTRQNIAIIGGVLFIVGFAEFIFL